MIDGMVTRFMGFGVGVARLVALSTVKVVDMMYAFLNEPECRPKKAAAGRPVSGSDAGEKEPADARAQPNRPERRAR